MEYTATVQPEIVVFNDMLQFIVVIAFVVYFDGCSNEQSIKRTNRTLYLRRLSTASLTCYVWTMLLGCIIRGYLPYNKANIFQFIGLEILYFAVQFVLLIGLDSADWIWTPDWLASSIPKICTQKFKKGLFANNVCQILPAVSIRQQLDELICSENRQKIQKNISQIYSQGCFRFLLFSKELSDSKQSIQCVCKLLQIVHLVVSIYRLTLLVHLKNIHSIINYFNHKKHQKCYIHFNAFYSCTQRTLYFQCQLFEMSPNYINSEMIVLFYTLPCNYRVININIYITLLLDYQIFRDDGCGQDSYKILHLLVSNRKII
ncbi:Conserved_hypothetical protein [Hexamita inflata]|uniref:Uncharacterized protein n=1 Tax=Hexamita inflata TaxID=28002 RepID=A0AA86QYB7_9EUKA|nr:Conserved hypothetical protein [Hexamita inflata]